MENEANLYIYQAGIHIRGVCDIQMMTQDYKRNLRMPGLVPPAGASHIVVVSVINNPPTIGEP